MEAGSVTSSIDTASALQAQVRARQPEQDEQTQQSQQSQQTQRTREAQSNPSVEENRAAGRAQTEVEASRPAVNANGQTVGTRVNTTA